ncbi:MAG: DUF5668 domain-containing protein [Clostridia bacterium]|nr:DUF5668 domain-containing protein [Clostridia bacterium]
MNGRSAAGIILVVVGAVALLANLGMMVRFGFAAIWPLAAAAVGFMIMRDSGRPGRDHRPAIIGLVLFLVGAIYFLRDIGLVSSYALRQVGKFWPVLIIALGVMQLIDRGPRE